MVCKDSKRFISCSSGLSIEIVKVTYGGKSLSCKDDKTREGRSTPCELAVTRTCNGRRNCMLEASAFGKQCDIEALTLQVQYRCRKGKSGGESLMNFLMF